MPDEGSKKTVHCPKCQSENPETKQFCGDCGTQLTAVRDSRPQATITLRAPSFGLAKGSTFAGRYQVIEELGKGGMGRVYRVFDTTIKEEIALKLINPEIAADPEIIERFGNELKLARKIRHKNVCGMFDLNEAEGVFFITMELVQGEDLKSMILASAGLNIGTTLGIVKQLCEGLAEAHRLGVIHRDLKPANIMIDKEGSPKIMDFGIARSLQTVGRTGTGVMIGTPEYMSPEQAEGREVDERSDIYSLGVILYDMLTGSVPFSGDSPLAVAMKLKSQAPPDPRSLNPQIPADLSRAVLRCLEKDKSRRYPAADALLAELERIEQSLPAAARDVRPRKPRPSRKITVAPGVRRLLVPALAVLGVAAAAVIIRLTMFSRKPAVAPTGKPSLAIVYFENNTGDEKQEYWRSALAELLITDLSQSKYIRVVSNDEMYSILRKLGLVEAKKYSFEDLAKIAAAGRVSHVLRGTFVRAGQDFVITAAVQRIDNRETLSSHRVEAKSQEDIIPRIDDLTRQIKLDLNLTSVQVADDIQREIGKITTSSPEAYRLYSEGWKLIRVGKFPESIPMIEKSLAIDPEFAMAYRLLGMAYALNNQRDAVRPCLEKAMALSDRLSDRERLFIEATYYTNRGERYFDRAIDAYSKYLDMYPDDSMGNLNLGAIYYRLEEWDKALTLLERARKADPGAAIPISDVIGVLLAKGEYARLNDETDEYLRRSGENIWVRWGRAYAFLAEKKRDLAWAEAEKAEALDPSHNYNILIKGDLSLYGGDLVRAESEYRRLAEKKGPEAQPRLNCLAILRGKFASLKSSMNQPWEKPAGEGEQNRQQGLRWIAAWYFFQIGDPLKASKCFQDLFDRAAAADDLTAQKDALLGGGLALTAMNRLDEALGAAQKLKTLIDSSLNKKSIRLYDLLVGSVELKRNNLKAAIESLERGAALMPHENDIWDYGDQALLLNPLAQAYLEAGQQDKALETYRKITELTSGRLSWGDIYAKAFYMLGKIAGKQGDKARARDSYGKFLELWKDADPGLPEVDDARARLAALK